MPPAGSLPVRLLLHVTPLRRIAVEPETVYLLEADRGDTIVRQRSRRTIRDVRPGHPAPIGQRCRLPR